MEPVEVEPLIHTPNHNEPGQIPNNRCSRTCILVLNVIQLVLCLVAILLPHVVVGEMTLGDAKSFMEFKHQPDVINASHIVQAKIGFFKSFYNETVSHSYREGMGGIFGFFVLSAVSSVCTLVYSIYALCDEQNLGQRIPQCFRNIFRRLGKSPSASFGVIGFAWTYYAIGDLEGASVGICVWLHLGFVLLSGFIQLLNSSEIPP